MDCIIPGHSVRPFCAAIGCLSRVGKDLILEFDPVDGLTMRALSDSKAVFASFHYEPAFFDRCASPPLTFRKRKRTKSSNNEDEEQDNLEQSWCVRVAIKSLNAVVKPRKDVISLQLLTVGDLLAFEFQLQRPEGVVTRIIHKVGVAPAQSIAAVAAMDKGSELVVQPNVVLTMLEPLKRSAEMALLVNETFKLISGVSFAHEDIGMGENGSTNNNANTTHSSTTKSLKTETSIGYDELIELHYVSMPELEENEPIPPPDDIKEQVVLVFTIKEFKAMLQFCAQSHMDQELPVTIQFYWGGKPMVVTTKSIGFSAELVMATLDHKLLEHLKTVAGMG